MSSPLRVLTQHAVTGDWLSKALPLSDLEYGPELDGPGALSGKLSPRLIATNPSLLDPGTTLIYVEQDGQLRWGGLVWDARAEGDTYSIEAAGWTSYLQKRFDIHGQLNGRGPYTHADRCTIMRDIWDYAQSAADGDLGVTVDSTTSKSTIGTPAQRYDFSWWEWPNLGDRFDDLVSAEAAPQYTCTTYWNTARDAPIRRVRIGYPRLGTRRTDISFASGVNIIDPPTVPLSGDEYAQVVIASGAGDGSAKRRAISAVRNGRLRLEHVLDLPHIKGNDELASRASAERAWRQTMGNVEEITVRDHPAAPWNPGRSATTYGYVSTTPGPTTPAGAASPAGPTAPTPPAAPRPR
ncbi:hypothetical protein [Streptomyces sp. Wb2n-11]|uniref:hypothetical protein n=1 Tax=Streptomyces sp. Wb2n-11 TaxID=1030533 RepID=UPI000AB4A7AD|nr:hypothetical protein [Streptomyces sp. Wb2n-11]